jgi:hypothetical protein
MESRNRRAFVEQIPLIRIIVILFSVPRALLIKSKKYENLARVHFIPNLKVRVFVTLRTPDVITRPTVNRTRKRYCEEGLDSAINDKPRSGAPPKIDGTIEAQVTLLACSKPPEGKSTWTLKLLADKIVEMEVVESISAMTIQRILKKAKPNLGRKLDGVLAR